MAPRPLRVCAAAALVAVLLYAAASITLLPYLLLPHRPLPVSSSHSDDEVLTDFFTCVPGSNHPCAGNESSFFFGLATAPAHVEDTLDDTWLQFARHTHRPVAAWHTVPLPHERLRFWSDPDSELRFVKESGASVFRLGIDWGRVVPTEPLNGTPSAVDHEAVNGYFRILQMVRTHRLHIMVTLFHHSLPKWAIPYGGWVAPRTITYFVEFAAFVRESFGHLVDYWVTFNEPHIFVLSSHCLGTWPPGRKLSGLNSLLCYSRIGAFGRAMDAIIEAHKLAYRALHEEGKKEDDAPVGVAHHVGVIRPYSVLDVPIVLMARWLTQYHWIDHIRDHLDFCGLNYYGQEVLSSAGLMLDNDEEYSEAGRGVYPDGLYEILLAFHKRYKDASPGRAPFRYIITENGIADARDILRKPYLVEHLLALSAAMSVGVPVDGYLHWTVSDNWEWADGYCPKFGLIDVDRAQNLTRRARSSFYLYQQIAKSGVITGEQRQVAWHALQREVKEGGFRPFCRKADHFGRMWADGLDTPITRPLSERDWRLGHYQIHGFPKYAARSLKVAEMLLFDLVNFLFGGFYGNISWPSELRVGEL
ncbi:hypothetical protein GOP47_0004616 [Adiantum capillus-veneris]|uniref:Beta-glucosidase n=1 Tax=Adiantum capillus-veneris TaxID=13818 RepID=A0A9D4V875_ADICA|nr:hypothetical protein GOP47_0004616 [Adiantum capillus-veneris]